MLLAMTSVSPSLNNINHGSPSLTSSPSSRPGSARHLSPCAIWSNRYQGISKGYRSRTSSTTSGGIVRNLGFLLPEQILQSCDLSSASTYSSGYTASRKPSPRPHSHREHVESDSAVVWSMPTPPRSESGATSRSPATAGSYPLADATGSSDASSTRSSMRSVPSTASCICGTLVADLDSQHSELHGTATVSAVQSRWTVVCCSKQ